MSALVTTSVKLLLLSMTQSLNMQILMACFILEINGKRLRCSAFTFVLYIHETSVNSKYPDDMRVLMNHSEPVLFATIKGIFRNRNTCSMTKAIRIELSPPGTHSEEEDKK